MSSLIFVLCEQAPDSLRDQVRRTKPFTLARLPPTNRMNLGDLQIQAVIAAAASAAVAQYVRDSPRQPGAPGQPGQRGPIGNDNLDGKVQSSSDTLTSWSGFLAVSFDL